MQRLAKALPLDMEEWVLLFTLNLSLAIIALSVNRLL